jgi:two-component system, NarL family, nitrate/nitrite response regulator NarL
VPPFAIATIRVAVIGEDSLARAGIVALFADRRELALVAQGPSAEADRAGAEADVVLWDVGGSAVATTPAFEDGTIVVALVADDRQAGALLALGARGVVPRDVAPGRLVAAVAAANEGLVVVDEAFGEALGRREARLHPPIEPLTPRELEVLSLLGEGLTNKGIAGRLGISESTAKFHVNSILGKLGVGSRSEAIVHASRLGLVVL